LGERENDVILIAEHRFQELTLATGRSLTLGAEALETLKRVPLPGNVRDVHRIVAEVMRRASGQFVTGLDILNAAGLSTRDVPLDREGRILELAKTQGVLRARDVDHLVLRRSTRYALLKRLASYGLLAMEKKGRALFFRSPSVSPTEAARVVLELRTESPNPGSGPGGLEFVGASNAFPPSAPATQPQTRTRSTLRTEDERRCGIISILTEQSGLAPLMISSMLRMARRTTTRTLKNLCDDGLVTDRGTTWDRRYSLKANSPRPSGVRIDRDSGTTSGGAGDAGALQPARPVQTVTPLPMVYSPPTTGDTRMLMKEQLALDVARDLKTVTTNALSKRTGINVRTARRVLVRLVVKELLEATGVTRGKRYHARGALWVGLPPPTPP